MISSSRVRVVSGEAYDLVRPEESADTLPLSEHALHDDPDGHRLPTDLRRAIALVRENLLAQQHPSGYWVGELEGDTILESEYLLLLAFLGEVDTPLAAKLAAYLLEKQLPEGGWGLFPGGGIDVSVSVKAYFALKITGHDPRSEPLRRARVAILAAGGADAVNSFTRFYLALLGQISYEQVPSVPPEVILLPRWFPVNLYAVSAWSRTMIVPLSVMWSQQPVRRLPAHLGIRELFLTPPAGWPLPRCPGLAGRSGPLSWDWFFRGCDSVLKWLQRRRILPLRRRALAAAERWMCRRFEGSDGLGAIFPPMVWSVIALKGLGYRDDSPELRYCRRQLDRLVIEDEHTARLEPCKSPVWDTAITLRALAAAGHGAAWESSQRGLQWLLARQIDRPGDWAQTVDAAPGGWCFEFANDFYPDLDDTVMAMMALDEQILATGAAATPSSAMRLAGRSQRHDADASAELPLLAVRAGGAIQRARDWVLAMQNDDGGWGAFDRNNDREFLCHVPFADHNAMIDPSTPDLTGRVLEALGQLRRRVGDPVVDRAVAYLRRTQEADGSWYGRWGVNYIYGTWQVIVGLAAVGVARDDPQMVAAADWLVAHQQSDGGWGETPETYAQPHLRGQGPTTPSQTAWAVLGLIAAGRGGERAVADGVRFLLKRQLPDGTWDEPQFTGTGFPRVFYLRYHMYPIYFPLLALARYAQLAAPPGGSQRVSTASTRDALQARLQAEALAAAPSAAARAA